MKSKAILMALLALTFTAQAVPVSQSEAGKAVQGWMLRNQERRHPGKRGRLMRIRHAATHETEGGNKFHSFRMQGGGTVITSADTDDATVIAFTANDVDFTTLDPKNPLWALITQDLRLRGKARALRRADERTEKNGRRWVALKRLGSAKTAASLPNAVDEGEDEGADAPSDLRVPALVKSQWGQGSGIWNYYTPNGAYPSKFEPGGAGNVVCGCVATAMSQLMRYHEYPTGVQTSVTRQCRWEGVAYNSMKLTTQAGEYDWANMPYRQAEITTDAQRQAIGKLTSDAGISVYMMYNDIGEDGQPKGESGAFSFDIQDALKSVWGYGSAAFFSAGSSTIVESKPDSRLKTLKRALFANFDAGFPTLMGVSGGGGHQIVADGYGYDDEGVDYVHLNMGWSGSCDMWYHLPEITYGEEGDGFTSVDDIVYNVMPYGTKTSAILSGRVTDETGAAVADAQVTVFAGDVVVTNAMTSKYGVWGVPVAAGTYTVRVDEPGGIRFGFCEDVSVSAPLQHEQSKNGVAYKQGTKTKEKVSVRQTTVLQVDNVNNLGNSWGNDVVLRNPTSMIVMDGGTVTNVFYSFEDAFEASRQYAAEGHPEVIDLLVANVLSAVADVDFDCTVRAATEYGALVFTNEAAFAVTGGARLTLQDVTLSETTTSESARIRVAAGATVEIGENVSIDGRIDVASADGFVLAGALTSRLDLNCAAATQVCQAFGTATTEAAGRSAANIVNWADGTGDLIGRSGPDGTLYWDETSPDPEESVGSYEEGGSTIRSRSYDRLFAKHEFAGSSAPIVLEKSGVLSRPLTLADGRNLTIGTEPGVVVTSAPGFGFSIGRGCTLKVDGTSFSGSRGPGLFVVDGGSLVLTDVMIDGAEGTNEWSGAVAVLKGTAGLTNVVIRNCRATGKKSFESTVYRAYGGGATVGGAGASLFLKDCTVESCWAPSEGGGIAVRSGGTLGLDGQTVVRGNTCGENLNAQPNDVCFASPDSRVLVTGQLSGDRTVGVRYNTENGVGNHAGDEFGMLGSDGVSSAAACADVFFNDTDSGIEAVAIGTALVWQAVKETYGTEARQPTSLVRVTDADGGVRYFDRIKYVPAETAAEERPVTVELLGDDTYPGDLAFTCDVTLATAAELDGRATLAGTGDGAIVLGENRTLTFGRLAFDGTVSRAPTAKVVLADAVGGAIAVDEATAGEAFGEVAPDFFAADVIAATNSAAKFTRSAPVATGLVATNGAGVALLVWSDAFSPDGKVIVDGETYYGIGDFGGEPPIPPSPIAFTSIVGDRTAGTWTVTFESAVEKCWYSLYETNSLVGGFEIEGVQPVARRPATSADVPAMSFTRPNDGSQLFWKVVAEPSDAYVVPGDLIPNP